MDIEHGEISGAVITVSLEEYETILNCMFLALRESRRLPDDVKEIIDMDGLGRILPKMASFYPE